MRITSADRASACGSARTSPRRLTLAIRPCWGRRRGRAWPRSLPTTGTCPSIHSRRGARGLREVELAGGYCTEECETDADCPEAMYCGEAVGARPSTLGRSTNSTWIHGKTTKIRTCMKR